MNHQMHLQPQYFGFIKSGTKRIELRLYDKKRQQIQLGDTITFTSGDDSLTATVIGLLRYDSFVSLFADHDISLLADASITKQALLDTLDQFYPPTDQARLGVLGIRIQLPNEI